MYRIPTWTYVVSIAMSAGLIVMAGAVLLVGRSNTATVMVFLGALLLATMSTLGFLAARRRTL